ncbi:hypothetical protein GCM10023184_24630 [Flaviaesturariibacter amylovorans]|uniref:Uncharacterized protein n=1 Tax=Flaviaesturariibacter amylovorans TaxID=1084520 RepID=A0ABP8GZX3_9BACT
MGAEWVIAAAGTVAGEGKRLAANIAFKQGPVRRVRWYARQNSVAERQKEALNAAKWRSGRRNFDFLLFTSDFIPYLCPPNF